MNREIAKGLTRSAEALGSLLGEIESLTSASRNTIADRANRQKCIRSCSASTSEGSRNLIALTTF